MIDFGDTEMDESTGVNSNGIRSTEKYVDADVKGTQCLTPRSSAVAPG